MGRVLALITAVLLLFPVPGAAQDSRATLEAASKALGADGLKSIQFTGGGVNSALRARTRRREPAVAPLQRAELSRGPSTTRRRRCRTRIVRAQGEDPPPGRGPAARPWAGQRQVRFVVSGDHAWNVGRWAWPCRRPSR